jgi:NAD(P)-dependent dehydrogenase (short-subunit alcohol dehydrogenase family)
MGGQYSTPHKETKHLNGFLETLPSMEGKVCAITGTTTGLGFHAARSILAKQGSLILLNRPSERAESALKRLQADAGDAKRVRQVPCDLQSFTSVRHASEMVTQIVGASGLDVLANNAGTHQSVAAARSPMIVQYIAH